MSELSLQPGDKLTVEVPPVGGTLEVKFGNWETRHLDGAIVGIHISYELKSDGPSLLTEIKKVLDKASSEMRGDKWAVIQIINILDWSAP